MRPSRHRLAVHSPAPHAALPDFTDEPHFFGSQTFAKQRSAVGCSTIDERKTRCPAAIGKRSRWSSSNHN